MTLREIENQIIGEILALYQGNKTQTARHLGVSIRNLRNRIEECPELKKWKGKYYRPKFILEMSGKFNNLHDALKFLKGTMVYRYSGKNEKARLEATVESIFKGTHV